MSIPAGNQPSVPPPDLSSGLPVPEYPAQSYNSAQLKAVTEAMRVPARPETIGHYRIIDELGVGGMGVVYLAEQAQPRRRVALKVIKPIFVNHDLLKRFAMEAEILGRLQHPGIAQIYEAGTTESPLATLPYFAMEFVDGLPLTVFAEKHKYSMKERLTLVAKVADAVHYAHQKGIIHRDLKPANILVTAEGQPKILDFGVARATDSDIQATTMKTDLGQIIGTLAYMAPEQAAGRPEDLDTRSDVYALGVVAYELLAGRRPYNLVGRLLPEAARLIREEEPSRLSSINKTLGGDIETIVSKALDKEKNRRYQSATEFAADIRRYLRNEPIIARPSSTWYQLRKFAARNKILVAGLASVALALVSGIITTEWQAHRAMLAESAAIRSRDEALAAEAIATRSKKESEDQRTQARQELGVALLERARGLKREARHFAAAMTAARAVGFNAVGGSIVEQYPPLLVRNSDEWNEAERLAGAAPVFGMAWRSPKLDVPAITCVGIGPDANTLAVGGTDGTVLLWDLTSGHQIAALRSNAGSAYSVALAPDGRSFACARHFETSVQNLSTHRTVHAQQRKSKSSVAVLYPPSGNPIACELDQTISITDMASGKSIANLVGHASTTTTIALSPDGTEIATGSRDATVRLWNITSGKTTKILTGHTNDIVCVAYNRDGRLLATASPDGTVRLWNLITGETLHVLEGKSPLSVDFSPDSRLLAVGSADATITLWEVSSGKLIAVLEGHVLPVRAVRFASDGDTLISLGEDRTIRLWDVRPLQHSFDLEGHDSSVSSVAFSHDGATLASAGADKRIIIWDLAQRRSRLTLSREKDLLPVKAMEFNRDGSTLATVGDGSISFWDLTSGKLRASINRGPGVPCIAFNTVDDAFFFSDPDSDVKIQDAHSASIASLGSKSAGVGCLAVSDDGRTLAGAVGKEIRLWNYVTKSQTGAIIDDRPITFVAYGPAGKTLASVNDAGVVRLWDAHSANSLMQFASDSEASCFAFSDDIAVFSSGRFDGFIELWDVQKGQLFATLDSASGGCNDLALSPDGKTIAIARPNSAISVYKLPNRVALFPYLAEYEFRGLDLQPKSVSLDQEFRYPAPRKPTVRAANP